MSQFKFYVRSCHKIESMKNIPKTPLTNKAMKSILIIYIIFINLGCYSQERKIEIINSSKHLIDSVHIIIFSADTYQIKRTEVKPNDTLVNIIPSNKPKSNNHDITVDIIVYIKDYNPINQYSYSDLGGILRNDYQIIIDKSRNILLKSIFK